MTMCCFLLLCFFFYYIYTETMHKKQGKDSKETEAIRHGRVMEMIEELGLEKVVNVRGLWFQ